ncbi:hypothetical protein X798_02777, partial [Onchocerca flexuosa]
MHTHCGILSKSKSKNVDLSTVCANFIVAERSTAKFIMTSTS